MPGTGHDPYNADPLGLLISAFGGGRVLPLGELAPSYSPCFPNIAVPPSLPANNLPAMPPSPPPETELYAPLAGGGTDYA